MIDKHPSRYKLEKSADKLGTSLTSPHSFPIFYTPRQPKLLRRALNLKVRREEWKMCWCVFLFYSPSHIYRKRAWLLLLQVEGRIHNEQSKRPYEYVYIFIFKNIIKCTVEQRGEKMYSTRPFWPSNTKDKLMLQAPQDQDGKVRTRPTY